MATKLYLIRVKSITETYHMIDKCNSEIATWSESGDNFVVKDLDKFAKVS